MSQRYERSVNAFVDWRKLLFSDVFVSWGGHDTWLRKLYWNNLTSYNNKRIKLSSVSVEGPFDVRRVQEKKKCVVYAVEHFFPLPNLGPSRCKSNDWSRRSRAPRENRLETKRKTETNEQQTSRERMGRRHTISDQPSTRHKHYNWRIEKLFFFSIVIDRAHGAHAQHVFHSSPSPSTTVLDCVRAGDQSRGKHVFSTVDRRTAAPPATAATGPARHAANDFHDPARAQIRWRPAQRPAAQHQSARFARAPRKNKSSKVRPSGAHA